MDGLGNRAMSIWNFLADKDYKPTMQQEVDYNKYLQSLGDTQNVNQNIVQDVPLAPLVGNDMNTASVDLSGRNFNQPTINTPQTPVIPTQPITPNQPITPQGSAPVEEKGFMDKVGDYLGNEENRLNLALAFNSMRLNPDDSLATGIRERLKSIRAGKGANKTVGAIQQRLNTPGISDSEKARLQMILKGVQDGAITPSDAFTMALKRESAPLVKFGDDNKAMYDAVGKDLVDRKTQFRELSVNNKNLFEQYDRLDNLLSNMGETGLTAEFQQNLRETFGGLPILSKFIDSAKLGQGQELRAVLNNLVLTELRKNKGPQTDFDAIFAGKTLPSLGNTKEANTALVKYGKSASRLQTLMGEVVSEARYSEPQKALDIMNIVDKIQASTPGVMYHTNPTTGVTKQVYFEDWYNAPNQQSLSAYERLIEWTNIKREMDNMPLINLDILKIK